MKKTIILSTISGLCCACSSIPVPVTPGIALPNLMPQITATNYVPQADPFTAQPPVQLTQTAVLVNNAPASTAPATIISPPVVATPAAYSPAVIPAVTVTAAKPVNTATVLPAYPAPVQPVNTTNPVTKPNGTVQNLSWLATRILKNQTTGDPKKLITWNEKENFVALGIGHFIWYPVGKKGQFNESFPVFLNYAKAQGAPLPAWLANQYTKGAPWLNNASFARAQNDPQMAELHSFMNKTLNLQANFMVARLKQTVPVMLQTLPANQRQRVQQNYQSVAKSPGGIYPLLDYIQFKGSGINQAERYRGQGWGLLQVLQEMQTVSPGAEALAEFRRAADDVLVRRIANAPAASREARYLSQWLDRISTYNPGKSS